MYEKKIKHKLSDWLKTEEEELSEAKYGQRSKSEETKVRICEPEQGTILGEDDDGVEEEESLDKCPKEWLSAKFKHREMIPKSSKELENYHVFETNNLCVNASYAGQEDE